LDEEEEAKAQQILPSPDAETSILFTQPVAKKEFPAGHLVKFLVGLYNKGSQDFVVDSMEASFRYPMDYSFYIRNYSTVAINRIVPAKAEATFDYTMIPAEDLSGRPFGLTVNLNYRYENGTVFQSAVFNETIHIIEDETNFNPETGFLYAFFISLAVLLAFLGYHFVRKMRRKHGLTKKSAPPVEIGTQNSDVDWEWIPKSVLNYANKSPRPGSPQKSPRQRKGKGNQST